MRIYVGVIEMGFGDEFDKNNVYVGNSLKLALETVNKIICDFGYVEVWVDGKNIRNIDVK